MSDPVAIETVTIDGVTFEPLLDRNNRPSGREIARRDGVIVGDIVPDGFGRGGWAWRFDTREGAMPLPEFCRSRAEARAFVAGRSKASGRRSA